jgi:hypothetical protein
MRLLGAGFLLPRAEVGKILANENEPAITPQELPKNLRLVDGIIYQPCSIVQNQFCFIS